MTTAISFFSACLMKGDLTSLTTMQREWLDVKERVAHDFILDYYRESGELPPFKIFADKYRIDETISGRPGYYLRELRNRYIIGSLTDRVPRVMRELKSDPLKGLEELHRAVATLKTDTYTSRDIGYSDNPEARYKAYIERKRTGGITHLSTGVTVLDETFYGYREADLITYGGRSGVGKSWLLIWLAVQLEYWLRSKGITQPILFISNEMPEDEIMERIDCTRFSLPYSDFIKGMLNARQEHRYKSGLAHLRKTKSAIKIIYNCATIEELTMLIEVYKPVKIFIDGSYMMEASGYEGWEKIQFITGGLKKTAKSKRVPISNTTQLRRAAGKGERASIDAQDEFAYAASYTRDSDIAFRMFQSKDLVFGYEFGIEAAKARRMKPETKFVFYNNLDNMEQYIRLFEEPPVVAISEF